MLTGNNQHLKFQCGPYGLLIDIAYIFAIEDYKENSEKTSSKTTSWNNIELLFIDLRYSLYVAESSIKKPQHVLVLKNATTDEPFVMIAVDEVHNIIEIQESQWYELNGINPQLDMFFDRAYPDNESNQIFMRLAPVEQWATHCAESE
ncbi:MAG TPA: hypothetical protein VLB90_10560 [Pseudomonadales bacterium]|nr:hypothetical protein [Pseudomonadales bacterium]